MRIKTIRTVYFIAIFFITLRLFYWQIIMSDDLVAKAEDQRLLTKEVIAPRGQIRYSDGSILAATEPMYLLFAQPRVINEQILKKQDGSNKQEVFDKFTAGQSEIIKSYKKQYAHQLAVIFWEEDEKYRKSIQPPEEATKSTDIVEEEGRVKLGVEAIEKVFYDKLNKDLVWVSLNRKVDSVMKKRLEGFNLVGLGFEPTTGRYYPEGSSSAHILGFVGSDAYGADTGYFGLEGYYNGELKGKKGLLTEEKDAMGLPILIGKFISKDPKPGKTLVLSVDRSVQKIVEDNLKQGVVKYGAKSGSVVVMEPKTGNILAMASVPSYDPVHPTLFPSINFKNPITADSYEPGSTFKVLVMAAALNEKLITPETVCDICSGPVSISGFSIRTWNNQYKAGSTMTDVIIHSDNTGMVFVSRKLGIDKMYDYIQKFGFGKVTGIDLQDEQSPDIRPKKDWKEIDLATSSFGQGISATPLQIIRAVGAIANGGKLMEPHIVTEIKDGDSGLFVQKNSFVIKPRLISKVVSEESANQVKEMMVKAVDLGEAQFYKKFEGVGRYKIAGKTGTAQIPVAGHYDPTKTIASFVGFAPADDPKFVMLVRFQEPTASIFGADTAAPTFFSIARELFTYYGIAPSE